MKTKRVFLAVSITALILTVILISLKAYYVVIALVAGTLLIGHRELWSLVRRRKLPPVDERVRENAGKSLRNSFIFFAIASAFLMLLFSINLTVNPEVVHVPATSVKATDVASGASVAGRYQNSKRKERKCERIFIYELKL